MVELANSSAPSTICGSFLPTHGPVTVTRLLPCPQPQRTNQHQQRPDRVLI